MHIPRDARISLLLDSYRAEDAADHDVRTFLDAANYGEYRSAVVDRLRRGLYVYAAELTGHYAAELQTALNERESPDVTALSFTDVAEAWHDDGICHLWDVVEPADGEAISGYTVAVEDQGNGRTVMRLDGDPDLGHLPGTCALSSAMGALARDLTDAGIGAESVTVQMWDKTIGFDDVFGPDFARTALAAAGWRVAAQRLDR